MFSMARRKDVLPETPAVCPVCGEDVPPNALACPQCGADHKSGWREDADICDGADLPDEEFNHDEGFVCSFSLAKNEFSSRVKPAGIKPLWWITAIIVLIALVVFFLAH